MQALRERIETELCSNILPFWLKYAIDEEYGGFRGKITNDLVIDPKAPKGLILNARILWTFSEAYRHYGEAAYLQTARRAFDYLVQHFRDQEFGGVYWMLDYQGRPIDTKKRIYGQAFTVYAFATFYRATRDAKALELAIQTYYAIERASYDNVNGGYFETYERDWTLAKDQRLSDVDMDEKKSMNTHLHLMEAYASLFREWKDETLRKRLDNLIRAFRNHIINPQTHHFWMFFDEQWQPKSDHISYGHDIEGSWLLCEAAEILGDAEILKQVKEEVVRMAAAVLREAVDQDGGLLYEADAHGIVDSDKHWWPQAEAVVGFLNAYELSGERRFYEAAERSWEFIDKYIVDHKDGEWFWRVSREGIPSSEENKVDPWKCPYHNGRTCFEAMTRLKNMNTSVRTAGESK